jgi:hypothetical protein
VECANARDVAAHHGGRFGGANLVDESRYDVGRRRQRGVRATAGGENRAIRPECAGRVGREGPSSVSRMVIEPFSEFALELLS